MITIVNEVNMKNADYAFSSLIGYVGYKKFLIIKTDDHKLCYVSFKSTKAGMPSVKVKLLFAKVLDKVNNRCFNNTSAFNIPFGIFGPNGIDRTLTLNMPFVYTNFLSNYYSFHSSKCLFIYTTDSIDEAIDIYNRKSLVDKNGLTYIPKIEFVRKEPEVVNLVFAKKAGYSDAQFKKFCESKGLDADLYVASKDSKEGIMVPVDINHVSYYQACLFLSDEEEDIGYKPILNIGKTYNYFDTPDYIFAIHEFVPSMYPVDKKAHLTLLKK